MNRTAVESSNLKSIGHDGKTLEVEFSNGSVYRYENVPVATFNDFMSAESKGRFFAQKIRGLPSTRVDG